MFDADDFIKIAIVCGITIFIYVIRNMCVCGTNKVMNVMEDVLYNNSNMEDELYNNSESNEILITEPCDKNLNKNQPNNFIILNSDEAELLDNDGTKIRDPIQEEQIVNPTPTYITDITVPVRRSKRIAAKQG